MPNQLPSGRWRARAWHPRLRKQVPVRQVIGGPDTYATEPEAAAAEQEARRLLAEGARAGVTVREWWQTWTTDPLWARPSPSTMIHYREATQKFVERYGDLAMRAVGDLVVAEWLRGGSNAGAAKRLATMWNDAASIAAGRLVDTNPWLGLKLPRKPRKDRTPPGIAAIARMVELADELTPPSFAAYLDFACHEGTRPGENDALRWTKIDFQAETVLIDEQWNVKQRAFTLPKHGQVRKPGLTDPAATRLLSLPRESEFVFPTLTGEHYTPSTRSYHWNRVRCAAGLGNVDLYACTRHYFGWYAWNVLRLDDRDIALHLGHQDGGKLVRTTYGHADEELARRRIVEAYRQTPPRPIPLRRKAAG
jgi:integrase